MATNDIYQLSVIGETYGSLHIHTLHFREIIPHTDGNTLLDQWLGAPLAAYRGCFSGYIDIVKTVRAQKVCGTVPLPSPDERNFVDPASKGLRVSGSEDFFPNFMAALTTVKGSIAGKRYSGRYFLGGMHEGDSSLNTITPAHVARLTAYADALTTAFITSGVPDYRLFAFSRLLAHGDPYHTKRNPVSGGPRLADPVASVQCQLAGSDARQLVVSTFPTTMRSRKLGHGA